MISLPQQKTKIKTDLSELIVFIFGPKKFGKTTWCAQSENALFLSTEPGTSAVSVYETPIIYWEQFYEVFNLLAAGGHQFKTNVIDTADNMWQMCMDYVCRANKVQMIQDVPWGKGMPYALKEFRDMIMRFASLPMGLYLTSHTTTERIETRGAGAFTRTVPSLPTGKENKDGSKQDGAREVITKLADFNLFCDFHPITASDGTITYDRVIRCLTGADFEGGSRFPMPPVLPLDYNIFVQEFQKSANMLVEQENRKYIQRVA